MSNLVKESVEFKISSEVLIEQLNSVMEHNSVIVTRFCNYECISLPQENCREICIEREDIKEQFYEFN